MKVVLAVDLDDQSNESAKFLCRLPEASSMEVSLVTVLNMPEFGIHASTELWYPEFLEQQREAVDAKHREVATFLEASGITVKSHRLSGHIGDEIVRHAEKFEADWIVVGATGHTAIGRLLLGSVSDYVATHAKCSVLVVRKDTLATDEPMKFSVAYDHSKSADKVIGELTRRAWPRASSLQLITAVTPIMAYRDDLFPAAQDLERQQRTDAQRFADDAASRIKNFDAGVVLAMVEGEHIGDAIVTAADDFGSNLLVVGDKGHSLFERLMLGSTSRYILHHAHQSVLVIR
jgi:nucleotide-binding universal stress UspA family protein